MAISEQIRSKLLAFQKNEITENRIYLKLAGATESRENRRILEDIAEDEMQHYRQWKEYTREDATPDRVKIWQYCLISRVLGLTFGLKLMERGEEGAHETYRQLPPEISQAYAISDDEQEHERSLLELLDEERLRYIGSVVLGLNDALVELTGALAGLTLALRNTRLIALTGSITGVSAALSMAASEYLSTKSEETTKTPLKASIYTGIAYVFTVLALILPYLLLENYFLCLACTLAVALLIIAVFNFYISVAKDLPFKTRFLEMTGLSFGVAGLSFLIGIAIRIILDVDV